MEPQREPVGAPERLDVPFELKTIQTLTGDDGVEVGVFEGLASTFGNQDMVGDVVEPGAFAATIARPGRIKMLWQHDARAPIGVWDDIRETAAGLEVKGRLVLQVQRAREALALLKAGAVDALSIGFSVMRGGADFDRERGLRRIKAVELWEISVVTFPANPKARVDRIKARAGGLPTEREFERLLMRDAGLSRSQARTVLTSGYKALLSTRDAGGGLDELVASIQRVTTRMAAASAAETPRSCACAGRNSN
ncbi:MAG: HK97 family phage prohead protease [Proteobacteria bacterium]|nr:HK97 family phage prohead protease [Pseudomonadota bacterium]